MDKYKLNENDLTDSQKKIIDKFHFEKTPITETNILESANKLPIDNSIVEEKHERRKKLIGYIDNLVFVYLVFYYKEILQLNNDLEYHIFDYTIQPISPPKNPILDEKNSLQFTLQEKNQNNESKELFLKFFRDIIFVPGKINVCTITDRETNIKFLVHCYHSSKDHLYYLDFQNFKYYIGQNATNIDDKIIKQAVTNIKNSVEKPDDISYAKFPDEFTG